MLFGTGEGMVTVASRVVRYMAGETAVEFEVEPGPGWDEAGTGDPARQVQDAVRPAVEAAKVVLDKIKDVNPDGVEVKFGVKVSGGANWVVASAAAEGSFEVTLTWARGVRQDG